MSGEKMKTLLHIGTLSGLAIAVAMSGPSSAQPRPALPVMTLSSSAFSDGGIIPNKYTQLSPPPFSPALSWKDAPPGTASFTVMVHDPDSPPQKSSEDTLHWMIFNVPGSATGLAENQAGVATLPDGSEQLTVRNVTGYRGMGARGEVYHHYVFELFALDNKLSLTPDASRSDIMKAMDGHVLAKSVYIGRFHE
jgi:hypothetical protein